MDYVRPCYRCGGPVTYWQGRASSGRAFEPDPYEPYRPHLCARATGAVPEFVPEFVPAVVLRLLRSDGRPARPEPRPSVSRGAVTRGLERTGPYARPQVGVVQPPEPKQQPALRQAPEPGFDL